MSEQNLEKCDVKGYELLESLALNLRSSWNHCADKLWSKLGGDFWEVTRNPWAALQTVSREKLCTLLADSAFSAHLHEVLEEQKDAMCSSCWFSTTHPKSSLQRVAYFSMEFMLSEALPIYSGGLGNVAGDQLKAASDLGVPVIGVGLLYSQGYFRQFIDKYGEQKELYPYNDPGQLPIKPLRLPNGEWLRIHLALPGYSLWLRTWQVQVGRRLLYLLDSNDIGNEPMHRGITAELYGGDKELRLQQEIVLGIGGWRLLETLGICPEVCHMNEGHAAFAILERASHFMKKTGQSFDVALAATRVGNLFTTHTAVAAGFDRFSPDLIEQYLKEYAEKTLKISVSEFLRLGQLYPYGDFNMAYLAIRGSSHINAVSELHGQVSRHLFRDLFPRFPEKEIPIGSITNGVHVPSWDSLASDDLWASSCGAKRWHGDTKELTEKIRALPVKKIWAFRQASKKALVAYARERLSRQLAARNVSSEEIERIKSYLDPNALTLGFARRFAEYKRPNLLLLDEERFANMLKNKERPVQLIIAGKAHPEDGIGHALIRKWNDFIGRMQLEASVVFLSDYDMVLTQYLVQGVDVWINTPRRPWEASGTSGMKVLVNGGLNLSELDGWWAEAYCPEVGWALGDRLEHGSDPNWDRHEADALYNLLEHEIIPQFYKRDQEGIPLEFMSKIQESMARLTPQFSSNRVVREYTEKFYLQAAENYAARSKNNGDEAKHFVQWKRFIENGWGNVRFGQVKWDNGVCEVEIVLNDISEQDVRVELYAEKEILEMKHQKKIGSNVHLYQKEIPKNIDISCLTPRILPCYKGLTNILECPLILWQK